MTSDLSIMKGLKNKSEESFRILYDKYFRLVYYQAYLILHSKEVQVGKSVCTFVYILSKQPSQCKQLGRLLCVYGTRLGG